jgi:hypothetical protein
MFEQVDMLIPERPPAVMLFLPVDITYKAAYLRLRMAECSISRLPVEIGPYIPFLPEPNRRGRFYCGNKVAKALDGNISYENVHMVIGTVDGNHFVLPVPDKSRYVIKKVCPPGFLQRRFSVPDRNNDVQINLSASVCHSEVIKSTEMMFCNKSRFGWQPYKKNGE